jgi:hypothetical protein
VSERLSDAEHARRGNFRPDRQVGAGATSDDQEFDVNGEPIDPRQQVNEADRMRVLRALPPVAKQIAEALLDTFWNFHPSAQFTLRCYVLSCARLEALQTARPPQPAKIHAEIAANVALAAALKLG